MTASSLQAQTVSTTYDTEASGTQAQENAAYITMLETFNTTGQPATGSAGFAFTDPATNTALYDPYAAARRTVANAQGLDLCVSVLGTGTVVTNYATGTTVETSLDDPNATTAHTNAIAAAPTSAGVTGGVIGGSLVSIGLPLQPVTGVPAPATPYAPDPGTAAWIAGIEAFAMTTALSFDPADDPERRLLGQPRDSELLAHAIWDESVNTWGVSPDDILLLEAEFGIYGSLPMIVVYFDDSYILVDGTNGIVSGPFADTVPYDPIPLLEGHAEYEPGTGARVVIGTTGCETTTMAKRWRNTPPDFPLKAPNPLFPTFPLNPPLYQPPPAPYPAARPYIMDPSRPGWQSDYKCIAAGTGCMCTSYSFYTDPTSGEQVVAVTTCNTGTGGCPGSVPPAPPATPPLTTPSPITGATCTTYYWR